MIHYPRFSTALKDSRFFTVSLFSRLIAFQNANRSREWNISMAFVRKWTSALVVKRNGRLGYWKSAASTVTRLSVCCYLFTNGGPRGCYATLGTGRRWNNNPSWLIYAKQGKSKISPECIALNNKQSWRKFTRRKHGRLAYKRPIIP